MKQDQASGPAPRPWWKYGYVWLVIAGPVAVILATIPTVWLTLAYPETLVIQDYNQKQVTSQGAALAPALQGRNHAATPRAAH